MRKREKVGSEALEAATGVKRKKLVESTTANDDEVDSVSTHMFVYEKNVCSDYIFICCSSRAFLAMSPASMI